MLPTRAIALLLSLSAALRIAAAGAPQQPPVKQYVYERPINYDGKNQGTVQIAAGDEAVDVIHKFAKARKLPKHVRKGLLSARHK